MNGLPNGGIVRGVICNVVLYNGDPLPLASDVFLTERVQRKRTCNGLNAIGVARFKDDHPVLGLHLAVTDAVCLQMLAEDLNRLVSDLACRR
ncbi:MAG: hypothetical protein JWN34_5668 [Bryobacterales bacterium]|nr:hypothetical protein [Bryobacterales bacterium]